MNATNAYPTIATLLNAATLWRKDQAYQVKAISWQPTWKSQGNPWIVAGIIESFQRFEQWSFPPEMIHYLGNLRTETGGMLFHESFLNHLQRWSPAVSLQCPPTGTKYDGSGPLFTLEGPRMEITMALEVLVREVPVICQFASVLADYLPVAGHRAAVQWPHQNSSPMQDGFWATAFKAVGIPTLCSWPGEGQLNAGAEAWRYEWPVLANEKELVHTINADQPVWIAAAALKNLSTLPAAFGCFGTIVELLALGQLPQACATVGIAPPMSTTPVSGSIRIDAPTLAN